MARVTFVPQFASFNTPAPAANKAFATTRIGQDRVSHKVLVEAMHFDQASKSIKVFCSDGNLRECRVERLESAEAGRALWRQLQSVGSKKQEVSFKAAGGFSPDKWFYTVE